MTLGLLIIVLVVIGLVLWLVPGIDANLRKLLIAVAVIAVIAWALYQLGIIPGGGDRIRVNTGRVVPHVLLKHAGEPFHGHRRWLGG